MVFLQTFQAYRYLQLEINPSLDGLAKDNGRVVNQDGEVVLAGVHDIGHQGQSNLTAGVLHLDAVRQDQGTIGLEGGAISVGSQLKRRTRRK